MNLKPLIDAIKNVSDYQNKNLYLVSKIGEDSAFLLSEDALYFATPSVTDEADSTHTKYLTLRTNVSINTVENSPSFKPGKYDLLKYTALENNETMNRFAELCEAYVNSDKSLSFDEFFYSLVNLFETEKETSFTNLVGAFGELAFIKEVFEEKNKDITQNWHNTNGVTDKYDFVFEGFNLEVKTTVKESRIFLIKHKQIFNEKTNYVLVINIEQDNSGTTLDELIEFLSTSKPFSSNLRFMIKLQKERSKVNPQDAATKRFSIKTRTLYLNKNLETIQGIPDQIDSITYNYDFLPSQPEDFEAFTGKL